MINRAYLLQLFDNDESMADRFIAIFREQMPGQLQDLRSALENGHWDEAGNIAHSLKSQFRYVGLDQAAEYCQLIENQPDTELALKWLEAIENEVNG